jgi:hypothetical protein
VSHQAVQWVLATAQDVPASCVAVLIGLAWHADQDGRGAYPGEQTLASYARKTVRQVRRDLRELQRLKLIEEGNQGMASHLRADRRPTVYDLPIDRTPVTGRSPTTGRTRPPADPHDRTSMVERPDIQGHYDRTPMSAEESSKSPEEDPLPRESGITALAAEVGATEEEMSLLVEKVRRDHPHVKVPSAWLRRCHVNGDLAAMLAEVRVPLAAVQPSVPARCGQCDAKYDSDPVTARVVWLADGTSVRCPRCHPLELVAS